MSVVEFFHHAYVVVVHGPQHSSLSCFMPLVLMLLFLAYLLNVLLFLSSFTQNKGKNISGSLSHLRGCFVVALLLGSRAPLAHQSSCDFLPRAMIFAFFAASHCSPTFFQSIKVGFPINW
jgi:hypothetical protein